MKKYFLLLVLLFVIPLACANNDYKEVNKLGLVKLHTWHFTSGIMNNAIDLKYNKEDVMFECSVDRGYLWTYENQTKTKTIKLNTNDTVHWFEFENDSEGFIEQAFIEIILMSEDSIIGYVVIRVKHNYGLNYEAKVLKSTLFPKVNGEYQLIPKGLVDSKIDNIKKQ